MNKAETSITSSQTTETESDTSMIFLSAKNIAVGTSTLTLAGGGGFLHYKYDLLASYKSTNDWIHTPEDLNAAGEWNKGYFWHKFTVLKYGKYKSQYLSDVVGNEGGDDKINTDRLIKYCHDRRYNYNYFSNRLELKKVKELCYLENQETFYSRFVNVWNWEYKHNKRILLIMTFGLHNPEKKTGYFLSFLISHYIFYFNVHNRHSISKLDDLMDYFPKFEEQWDDRFKSLYDTRENTKNLVIFSWMKNPVNRWKVLEDEAKKKEIFNKFTTPLLD